MANTAFTNGATLTDADWFNDVNRLHYTIFGDPADDAAARSGINAASLAANTFTGRQTLEDGITVSGDPSVSMGVTANDIYDAVYPGVTNYDITASILYLASGSTVITNSAVAGYFKAEAASGAAANSVALFGCGIVTANDGAGWGINTLLQDAATRVAGTGTGRVLVGAELDFNVMNPATEVTGCSVGGNSLSTPSASNGYQVSPLGTGIPWGAGFVTQDAAATIGISIGMLAASGADVDSQPLYFSWTDSGSTKRTAIIDVSNGFLRFESTGTLAGYAFQGASVFIDTGKSYSVNGLGVVSDRKTGYAAMTGTANKAAVYDTATVSLAQLAGRVMQLQADLTTHGLIGA